MDTFLITGSFGCIGAWVLRNLVDEGANIIATDLADDPVRPRLLLGDDELSQITFARLDVTKLDAVRALVDDHGVTHIIHLAGLQVPFCRANPSLGAHVNVVGTVNLFEAARHAHQQAGGTVQGMAYASSLAVLGPADRYPDTPVRDDVPLDPQTLYGVYKQANEGTARLYWQDYQVGSVGLRPYIVYGVARDQGLTSDIAKAILAVAAGRPFHINFSGPFALQYADDVAKMFIASARAQHPGAAACNLRNDVLTVGDFVSTLTELYPQAQLTHADSAPLPFPPNLDDSGLHAILGEIPHTSLREAIRDTHDRFAALLERGQVDLAQLG